MPRMLAIAASAVAALTALPAAAATYTFTLTGHDTAQFSLSSNPTPDYQDATRNYFQLYGITGNFNESGDAFTSATLTFYGNGGFDINSESDFSAQEFYGPAVFTGDVTAPMFVPGEYDVFAGAPGGPTVDHLVIREIAAAVPEPATWAMMILGFGLVGGGLRVKRRQVRVSYAA